MSDDLIDPLGRLADEVAGLRSDVKVATATIEAATQVSIREGLRVDRRRTHRWAAFLIAIVCATFVVVFSIQAANASNQSRQHRADLAATARGDRQDRQRAHDQCESKNADRSAKREDDDEIFAQLRVLASTPAQRAAITRAEARVRARDAAIVPCPAAP